MDPEPMWLEQGKEHTVQDYFPWIEEGSELRLAGRPPRGLDATALNATTRADMHAVLAHLSEARGDTKEFFEDTLCRSDPALLKDTTFMGTVLILFPAHGNTIIHHGRCTHRCTRTDGPCPA